MDTHAFLLQLVIILFAARFFGEVAAYFNIPAVIGELCAGILIGPSLFNFVEFTPSIQLLAEMGIIFLLFEVGIETDIEHLVSSGMNALKVAVAGVALPFLLGYCISFYYFDYSLLPSLFIGSTLTATSIGITLRVMKDLNKQRTSESQVILGAAVFDDIIGIILLAILYEFSISGHVSLWNTAKVLLCITLYLVVAPILVKIIAQLIRKWDTKSSIPGLLPATIVSLILLFSWMAYQFGAPELLGGFAAGLALSKSFFSQKTRLLKETSAFSEKVEKQMKPIVHLFTPIFFISIGLSLDLRIINWHSPIIWTLTALLLAAAIFGKFLSGYVLHKESWQKKCLIGTAMIPRGEVGLVFANIGLTTHVLQSDLYAALILVICATTLLAPLALRRLYRQQHT